VKNYYKILNVPKNATLEQIQSTYKKLAKKYHPDKNSDIKESDKFKDIYEAYDTLSDVDKRKAYDSKMSFSMDYGRWGSAFGKSDATSFKQPVKQEPPKGNDLKITLDLTLDEIAVGCEKTVNINKWNICNVCDGTGAKTLKTCTLCNGEGIVRAVRIVSIMAGRTISMETCKRCYGSKVVIDTPCLHCQGQGRTLGSSSIKIKVPKLVTDQNFIKIGGQGDAGENGGRCGDLIVMINELQHAKFKRKERDLYTKIDVNLTDLVLGSEIRVPSLYGQIDMKIPSGTQPNTTFRIKDKGIDNGDLFVELNLILPQKLTEEQETLFKQLKIIENQFNF
jgi:molecular chaperone DnaJ